jgi:hypothetical protein
LLLCEEKHSSGFWSYLFLDLSKTFPLDSSVLHFILMFYKMQCLCINTAIPA